MPNEKCESYRSFIKVYTFGSEDVIDSYPFIIAYLLSSHLLACLRRDSINCICSHLELFRVCKVKIEKQHSRSLTIEELDMELKSVLAAENKLHPALFSPEAEHKVLCTSCYPSCSFLSSTCSVDIYTLGICYLGVYFGSSTCRFSSILWMDLFH